MAKASKALVVFLAFSSVAFMGFAAVTTLGGTNWKDFLAQKNYDRHTKTLQEFVSSQDNEINLLRENLEDAEAKLAIAQATREADIAAMESRVRVLQSAIDDSNVQIIETTEKISVTGEEIVDVQEELTARREEVLKLRDQLKELRSQIDVTRQKQERVADYVIQAKELLKLSKRRNQRLKAQ